MSKKFDKQRNILLKIKEAIKKTGFEDVNWPSNNNVKNFIWIGFQHRLIGNDNCHYEFIFQDDTPNLLTLEIHIDEKEIQELFENMLLPDFLCFKKWNRDNGRIIFKNESIQIDDSDIINKSLNLLNKLHDSIGEQLLQIIQSNSKLVIGNHIKPKLLSNSRSVVTRKNYKERTETEATTFNMIHGKIQERLEKKLKKNPEYVLVTLENGFENLYYQIDLLGKKENEHYDIYEVKPYSTALACIREALGQILHYNFLLEEGDYTVDKLIIVGQAKITPDELLYLKFLKKFFSKTTFDYLNIDNL